MRSLHHEKIHDNSALAEINMEALERKKVTVITKYVIASFTQNDWIALGQLCGSLELITEHSRLFRSMYFSDDDYDGCAAEVLNTIFSKNPEAIDEVVDQFDVDLWYEQQNPKKYKGVFGRPLVRDADFWTEGYIKLFISHLSSNKERVSEMKSVLSWWGICAFVAHEDIEPSREWRDEVEIGLETMDAMVALVEPGFKESDWCSQEVGYALARKVEIIPLRAGMDPYGFFGKIQGIQAKGKYPTAVCEEIVKILLKKPSYRKRLLACMPRAFSKISSEMKLKRIKLLDEWMILSSDEFKALLEVSSLSSYEKGQITGIIAKVGAFSVEDTDPFVTSGDDVPF